MLSLSGNCIPLKVSLTVIKKVFLFFRVIIKYGEYRYMSFLGDLNRTFNLFKWFLWRKTFNFPTSKFAVVIFRASLSSRNLKTRENKGK